ncbi:redoxin domain-containing protein [Kordiimonas sp. SCSIO 12610]|uniref:redoxin domain-containing protein n=1 Tax=Kordiimonas sp. SCSIO 12610 TaxID=2829597 RepID=UPI00210B2548|nr:redoxin domain-containing protein [Kordiimonas sp. SCSIO 12610]UTW55270.1 redoxin domain-containing protein [Kordiimonas sp. SCSIO 12610]
MAWKTMNFIKAQFISFYLTYSTIVASFSIYNLISNGYSLLWIGVGLTSLPISLLIGYWMIRQTTPRTGSKLPLIYGTGLVGLGLVLFPVTGGPQSFDIPHLLAVLGFGFFLAYIYWYSTLGRKPSPAIEVGNVMPSFAAVDGNGNVFSTDFFEGKPALYLFFRGNWCPLCIAQIKEVVAAYKRLIDAGIEVALISPQPEKETRKLARKFDIPFHFLTDKNNKAAKILGIEAPSGLPFGLQVLGYDSDTVLPTVIAVDKEGKIILSDQTDNYRMRPEPETFLEAFGV